MNPSTTLAVTAKTVKTHYWPLFKSRQTFLLALTGAAGYLCQPAASLHWGRFAAMAGSLVMAISGCTVLNMVLDQDIDRKMKRTSTRPLAAGEADARHASLLGGALIGLGLLWSLALSPLYFALGLAGVALDLGVYTLWLKRRSAWSIIWGGLSGGMPLLAGRALAVGRVDGIGLLLALAIVCWIPSHNLTLSTFFADDYLMAGVPTFHNAYGWTATRLAMSFSSLSTAVLMVGALYWLGYPLPLLAVLIAGSLGLIALSVRASLRISKQAFLALYKYSSLYMLAAMLLLCFGILN
jgi:protoheme IX farnesyltransferase